MIQITLSKRHKKSNPFHSGYILCKRLNLLMVQQIHVFLTHLIKMICSLNTHCRNLNPMPVFPIASGRRYFPQVNLRIKVRCKCISVVTAIAIEDVNALYRIKLVLERICTVCLCHTRIKTRAKQRRDAGLLKLLPICPLP